MGGKRKTLSRQVLASLGTSVMVIMATFLWVTHSVQCRLLVDNQLSQMFQEAQSFRMVLQSRPDPAAAGEIISTLAEKIGSEPGNDVFVYYTDGRTVRAENSVSDKTPLSLIAEVLTHPEAPATQVDWKSDPPIASVGLPLYSQSRSGIAGILCFTRSIAATRQLAWQLLFAEAGVVLLVFAASVVAMYAVIQRRVAKPVLALYIHMHQAAHGEYHFIDEAYDPQNEISSLYNTFNILLKKITDQEKLLKELTKSRELAEVVRTHEAARADDDETQ